MTTSEKIIVALVALDICINISNHFKLKKLMTNDERFLALISSMNDATNKVAQDVSTILTAEKDNISEESWAKGQAIVEQLNALGASIENPIPGGTDTGGTDTGGGQTDTGGGTDANGNPIT